MEWEVEADYQIELINCIYAITPDNVEVQYNLGASFSAASGAKNKIMGFHSGWPDLTVVWPTEIMFLELKAEDGKLSKSQKECHAFLGKCGFTVRTTKTVRHALAVLTIAGIPLKTQYQYIREYTAE